MARESTAEEEIVDLMMRANDGVMIKGVEIIVADPGVGDSQFAQRRKSLFHDMSHPLIPHVAARLKVVDLDAYLGADRRGTGQELVTELSDMDARGIYGQRDILVHLVFASEDIGVSLTGFEREGDAGHGGNEARSSARCVDHLADFDTLAGFQGDGLNRLVVDFYLDHLIVHVVDPSDCGDASQILEYGPAVELSFVLSVQTSKQHAFKVEEGIALGYLFGADDLCARAECGLGLLVISKGLGKFFVVGQVKIAKVSDTEVRHEACFVLRDAAEILDKVSSILSNLDIDLGGKLLAHAVVACPGRRFAERWVSLYHQDGAFEVGVCRQEERYRGTRGGAANDDNIVLEFLGRLGEDLRLVCFGMVRHSSNTEYLSQIRGGVLLEQTEYVAPIPPKIDVRRCYLIPLLDYITILLYSPPVQGLHPGGLLVTQCRSTYAGIGDMDMAMDLLLNKSKPPRDKADQYSVIIS